MNLPIFSTDKSEDCREFTKRNKHFLATNWLTFLSFQEKKEIYAKIIQRNENIKQSVLTLIVLLTFAPNELNRFCMSPPLPNKLIQY